MGPVTFITRFVAHLPDSGERGREEREQVAARIDALGLTLLRREPCLLAAESTRTPAGGAITTLLDVFRGTAASARMTTRNFADTDSAEEMHRHAEASAQCYNLLRETDTEFVLESDMLGLKPAYVAATPDGHVVASRIADILSLFPALAQPVDSIALYEMLGFWAPLCGRTLHRQIRRTVPGGRYRWSLGGGLSTLPTRALELPRVEPVRFLDETIASIRETSQASLCEKTAGAADPIWLALSGGFDSRFIGALCRDEGIRVRALSYGRRHHHEWPSTRATARALKLPLTMVRQDRDATLHYLSAHLDATEGTADCGSVSILNLLGTPTEAGSTLLHGFCGDVLAGIRICDFGAADYASRETLADALIQHNYPAARSNLLHLFSPAPDPEEVRQDVLDGLNTECPPYQAYLQWFMENRTRRYVGAHFAVLGEHFDTVMPFYDRRLFDLWFSLPPVASADRSVFRKLMARYYPALARIPHSEEPAPIIPNLRSQLARLGRTLPRRALAGCIGREQTKNLMLRLYHDDDFRSFGRLEAPQQRAYMLSQIAELRPTLQEALGVGLSPQYQSILSADVRALRSLFTVASYAQRRQEQGQRQQVRADTLPQDSVGAAAPG